MDRFIPLPGRSRLLKGDLPQQLLPIAAGKRRLQRQHLVQRYTQRVDIGPVIDRSTISQGLLLAHVTQSADQIPAHGQAGEVLTVRQAEVGNPKIAARVHQQVGGLDVAMDDADLMGML